MISTSHQISQKLFNQAYTSSTMVESSALNFSWIESNRNMTFMEFIKTSGDSFSDVTLVSEDLQEFSAHKLVLSACSSFFQQILETRQKEHLVLFLSRVTSKDLSNILEFVYQGALNVPMDEVDQFVSAGNILNIKGIVNTEDGEEAGAEERAKKRRVRKKKVKENKDDNPDPAELNNDEFGSEAKIERESNIEEDELSASTKDTDFDQAKGLKEEDKIDNINQDAEIIIDEEPPSVVEELKQNYSKGEILNAYKKMMALKKMKAKEKLGRAREKKCDQCDYTTSASSSMSRHQRNKHRE